MAKFGALGIVALVCAGVIGAVLGIFNVEKEVVYVIIAGFALLLMPIFSSLTRRRLKAMGHKSYKAWAFSLPILPAGSIRKRARSLGDEELLGAWHQADYTKKAKEVIAEELRARGLNDAQIADWRPPAAQLTVRFPMPAIKPDRYFRTVRIRQGLLRVYRVSTGVVLILATVAFAVTSNQHVNAPTSQVGPALPVGVPTTGGTALAGSTTSASQDAANSPAVGQIATAKEILTALFSACLATAILMLPIIGLGGVLGRNRVRILLLRPFARPRITLALKRVVTRNLGPLGPVFTLSDRNLKPNFLLTIIGYFSWIPLLLVGPLVRPSYMLARVWAEGRYLDLVNHLTAKFRLGAMSFVIGNQAFSLRSTDAWWQSVMDLLMNSSEIIVMDVSHVGKGSAWEIHAIEQWGLLGKCIFVVEEQGLQEGKAAIEGLLPRALQPELLIYNQSGVFGDRAKLRSVLEGAVAGALATLTKQNA